MSATNSAVCNNIAAAMKSNKAERTSIDKQFDNLYAKQHKVTVSNLPAARKEEKLNELIAKGELLSGKQAHANLASARLELQAEKAGCDRM